MSKLKYISFLLFFILLNISAQEGRPELKEYVTDLTNTLSSSETRQLSQDLKTFDDSTSNQVVVLVISSTDGYPIEMYANEVAEQNGIGTKDNNNGILFLVAINDRKMRIEVGYGLEGALPDALASSIIRNDITPYFRSSEYYNGIRTGIFAIQDAIEGEYTSEYASDDSGDGSGFGIGFFIIIFIIIMIISKFGGRGGRRGRGSGIFYAGGGFGSGSSSGFGGGFSGGGGSFGGGGASGGW